MATIYTMGELLVELMRLEKNKTLGDNGVFYGPYPSAAPAIFISVAQQLGNKTKIWGSVGKDKFGKVLIERLAKDGVDISSINISEKKVTATAFVAYNEFGDREYIFTTNGSAIDDLQFEPTDKIPEVFHVMGCSIFASKKIEKAINKACEYYASKGAIISFDPNIRPSLIKGRDIMYTVGTVLRNTQILLPGVEELLMLAPSSETVEEAVKYLFDNFPKMEIINLKLGKDGARIYTRNKIIDIPSYPIENKYPILDTTGAGDSFDAGFISGIANNFSLKESGDIASKSGAINSIVIGPMEGKIKELINKNLLS